MQVDRYLGVAFGGARSGSIEPQAADVTHQRSSNLYRASYSQNFRLIAGLNMVSVRANEGKRKYDCAGQAKSERCPPSDALAGERRHCAQCDANLQESNRLGEVVMLVQQLVRFRGFFVARLFEQLRLPLDFALRLSVAIFFTRKAWGGWLAGS
jgi:hypothetical protein